MTDEKLLLLQDLFQRLNGKRAIVQDQYEAMMQAVETEENLAKQWRLIADASEQKGRLKGYREVLEWIQENLGDEAG